MDNVFFQQKHVQQIKESCQISFLHNGIQVQIYSGSRREEMIKEMEVEKFNLVDFSQVMSSVATPLWPSVGVNPNTWKSWELESSGTPECSELDSKGQNTSHWGVLGVIEKVLKRRYRKWPRIGHLDI